MRSNVKTYLVAIAVRFSTYFQLQRDHVTGWLNKTRPDLPIWIETPPISQSPLPNEGTSESVPTCRSKNIRSRNQSFIFSPSQYILQSVRRHSAIVVTVNINGMQEIHPVIYLLFKFSHNWFMFDSSYMRFLYHTQRRTTVGRTPLDEWSARRRDLYLTTHNTHNRQISMPPVGFEPTISVGARP